MLGSEYNWLIRLTRKAGGTTRVRLAQGGLLTLAVAVFCLASIAAHQGRSPAASLRPAPASISSTLGSLSFPVPSPLTLLPLAPLPFLP